MRNTVKKFVAAGIATGFAVGVAMMVGLDGSRTADDERRFPQRDDRRSA